MNLKGKHGWEDLTPEVQEFVMLAKDTTAETASILTTPFAKDLFEQVTFVKNRVKQEEDSKMGFVTDLMDARDEGLEAGIILGEQKGKKATMALAAQIFALYNQGMTIEDIATSTNTSIKDIMFLLGIKA